MSQTSELSDRKCQLCLFGISENLNHLGYADFTDTSFPRLANQNCGHGHVMLEQKINKIGVPGILL